MDGKPCTGIEIEFINILPADVKNNIHTKNVKPTPLLNVFTGSELSTVLRISATIILLLSRTYFVTERSSLEVQRVDYL